jgi:hypothetical protein
MMGHSLSLGEQFLAHSLMHLSSAPINDNGIMMREKGILIS